MASYDQTFLEHITNIHGVDFNSWEGWQRLCEWIQRQPWRNEFFGGDKIPSRMVHPATLVNELITYLEG